MNLEGKWQVSWENWPWRTYPSYLRGPAVLIPGGEGIRRLLNAAKSTPYYHIDDVYLNGLLPEKAQINVAFIRRFCTTLNINRNLFIFRYLKWNIL